MVQLVFQSDPSPWLFVTVMKITFPVADVEQFMGKVLAKVPELIEVGRLFRVLPFNLNAEFEFHETNSKVEPHCDLCSLFVNVSRELFLLLLSLFLLLLFIIIFITYSLRIIL